MLDNFIATYTWLNEDLLYRRILGKTSMIQLLNSFADVMDLKVVDHLPKAIITDLRHCDLLVELDELDQIKAHYKNHMAIYGNISVAIVVDDPQTTAFAQIARFRIGSDLNSQIFSTLETAENWVKSQMSKQRRSVAN